MYFACDRLTGGANNRTKIQTRKHTAPCDLSLRKFARILEFSVMKSLLNVYYHLRQSFPRWIAAIVSVAIACCIAIAPAQATTIYDLPLPDPAHPARIVDEGDVVSRINEGTIAGTLDQIAEQTGTQIQFVTIHHLNYGDTIETFTEALFEQWFPTPDAKADRVLLVLDVVTNTSAIRVGDRASTNLPAEIAQSVAAETLLVPIRQGDKYNAAFTDASDRLIAVLSGQPDPGPPQVIDTTSTDGTFASAEKTKAGRANYTTIVIVLLIGATVIPMVTYYALYR
jgi:uncharacterized protein